jgi:hypothetical protein
VCAVITLIVGLALIPTVVLAPFGILMITVSFIFAVTALQLYRSNESPVVTEGQVKAVCSECYSLKESKWYDRNPNCLNLENDYVEFRNDNMPSL